MKQRLFERRTKMMKYLAKGVPLREFVKDLAREYGVKDKAIYADHRKMKQWGPQVLQLHDDRIIYELLEGLRQIIPNAWHEYLTGDNTSAKVGALKLAKETYLDLFKVLQSIGRIEKVPEKIEVVETGDIRIYTSAIESAVRRDIEALRARKQVDTEGS